MPTFKMHSATLTVNGKEFDVRDVMLDYEAPDANDAVSMPKFTGVTVTIPFKLTDWVGFGWRYRLRELHLGLARYTTWPYTN